MPSTNSSLHCLVARAQGGVAVVVVDDAIKRVGVDSSNLRVVQNGSWQHVEDGGGNAIASCHNSLWEWVVPLRKICSGILVLILLVVLALLVLFPPWCCCCVFTSSCSSSSSSSSISSSSSSSGCGRAVLDG